MAEPAQGHAEHPEGQEIQPDSPAEHISPDRRHGQLYSRKRKGEYFSVDVPARFHPIFQRLHETISEQGMLLAANVEPP